MINIFAFQMIKMLTNKSEADINNINYPVNHKAKRTNSEKESLDPTLTIEQEYIDDFSKK